MEKFLEQAYLYDFYGELLTEHQKQIYGDFVLNDLSMSEIAEELSLIHIYLTRENPQRAMIWGLAAIFALLLAGIIGVGYYLCRRRMERITEQICDSIDQLIDGKRIEGSKDRETLTSKITMKLDKLSDVTASAVAQSLSHCDSYRCSLFR